MITGVFPIRSRRIVLRCLRDTDVGAFPEFRLGSFLLSADAKHKNHADSIALEVPRSAKFRYRRHDHFEFRLYAADAHRARLERIETMLRELPQSAVLTGTDIAFGDNWALHGIEDLHPFGPLGLEQLDEEVAHWRDVSRFRIRLASPWRIVPSAGSDNRRKPHVLTNPALVDSALLSRVLTQSLVTLKFQLGAGQWRVPELPLRIVDQTLWYIGSPASPGGKRPNVFEEGLFGECTVEWAAPPDDDQWRHLLLLARFGAGQGRAFGLGRLRLERLDSTRTAMPQSEDELSALCQRLIPNWPEFVMLPRAEASARIVQWYDAGWRARLSIALPTHRNRDSGIATPASRLSALLGASTTARPDDADLRISTPHSQRETLHNAVHYAMLARVCASQRLRLLWCEDRVLLLSQRRIAMSRLVPQLERALLSEAIVLHGSAVDDIGDPSHFAWCGYRFIGGLRLPGSETVRMYAVDERMDAETDNSQAA